MRKYQITYFAPNAGAGHHLSYAIEAANEREAREKFKQIYPLEEIISINS